MHILKKAVLAGAVCAIVAGPASAQSFGFATFHAVVNVTNLAARGSGVKVVTRPAVGRFDVKFTRPVTACTYTATPWGANGGQASVQRVAGQPADTITVFTFSRTGVPANIHFNLMVSCS
jgi:hypothetical protein